MRKLIIGEKPSLAKNIAAAIGNDFKRHDGYLENSEYIITWAFGHLFSLKDIDAYRPGYAPKEKYPWTLENLPFYPEKFSFELKKDIKTGKTDTGVRKQFKVISSLIARKDVGEIIHAGDADREGELIIRNILIEAGCRKPVKRLWLPEQTKETIRKSLKNLKSDDEYNNLFKEGLARTYIDWLYGVNLTRLATIKAGSLLRVGRVIVPAVKAIYDRDMEINNFKSESFYSCESSAPAKGSSLPPLHLVSGRKFGEGQLKEARDWCNSLNSADTYVADIKAGEKIIPVGKLYSLSKLQGALGKKYKMKPDESMKIIQGLYEKGYLTYPRTNTEYLACAEKDKINHIISKLKDKGYDVCPKDSSRSIYDDSKIESHSAITPTYIIPDNLTGDDRKVYDMVLSRFLAVFAAKPCKVMRTNVTINAGDLESFKVTGDVYLEKGWKAFEDVKSEDKELPPLSVGDRVNVRFEPVAKETKPPKHYTVETLNNYMKNPFKEEDTEESTDEDYKAIFEGLELGTEATRTGIISNAIKSGYISLKNNSYRIEPGGIFYIEALQKLGIAMDKEKTASLGVALKKVYRGDLTITDAVALSRKEIDCCFESSRGINLQKVAVNLEIIGKCPKCGGNVVVKSKGYFCENRECRFALWNTMKYYSNSVRITKGKAKTLIEGKHAPFKLKSKAGKEYKAYLKIVIKGDYVNLEPDGFVE